MAGRTSKGRRQREINGDLSELSAAIYRQFTSSPSCSGWHSTRAKSGWAKPLLPYIQPKQQITDCPSNPMHQGMCHCHHAPTTQSPCSHCHHACCSASRVTPPPRSPNIFNVSAFGQSFTGFISIRTKHAGSQDIEILYSSQISLSLSSLATLSHPHPPDAPPPSPSFNLLMTTWHGIASSSPSASPKPPGLRLGLIWTLCHPVSIHHPHSPILSSLLPPSSLPKRLWFKILYCEPPLPLQCFSACCQLQLFLPHHILSQSLSRYW